VTAGARLDHVTVDGSGRATVPSPRIGAVLPSAFGTWRASAGRGFRAPTLAERFVTTRAFGFQVVPNPGLRPETAWSFEIGNSGALASWGRVDAALFWTEARELMEPTFIMVDTTPEIQIQNLSRARLRVYLDTRDLTRDTVLSFRPRHLLTLSSDYRWRSLSVGADFRYTSRIERIELEDIFGQDPRVAARVLDLRAGWQQGPLSARILVNNALNYIYNFVPRTLEPVRTISVVATWTY
jgi:iron complex outermembrane receptor protein